MPWHESLVVVILAAGRSSRMGFPKALAPVAGELALARALRLARERSLATVVVLGFHAAAIRAAVELRGARVVENPDPERGQSSSISCGAAAIDGPAGLLLWPVDHAHVAAATLDRLLESHRARPPDREIVVPRCGGRRGHPLLGSAGVRREFAALRADEPGHRVLRRDPRRVLEIEVDDRAVIEDFDRPDELPPRVPGGAEGGAP